MNQEIRDRIAASEIYDDLTATAEHTIRLLMNNGNRNAAFGVWMMWYEATVGYQRPGDSDRLVALYQSIEYPA